MRKLCLKWVPRLLTADEKQQRVDHADSDGTSTSETSRFLISMSMFLTSMLKLHRTSKLLVFDGSKVDVFRFSFAATAATLDKVREQERQTCHFISLVFVRRDTSSVARYI